MSTYNSIAWLPLCAGLTGIGLVISYFAMRRRGLGSGLRGAAWSLLPLAAYLTGSIQMFWKIGTAIGDFAAHLVLSPKVWSGVGVAVLYAVYIQPAGSVALSYVILGERPSLLQLAGVALVLTGVVVAVTGRSPDTDPAPEVGYSRRRTRIIRHASAASTDTSPSKSP